MAKPFSVETEESRFRLPPATRQQIAELIALNQSDARSEIIIAVAERHAREIKNERDVFTELDALKERIAILEQIAADGYDSWFENNREKIGL